MSPNGNCPQGIENRERITSIQKQADHFETRFTEVIDRLDGLKDLISKRPSWPVVTLMVGLSTVCATLLTGIVSHVMK